MELDPLISNFESQAHVDEFGIQFWYARDLQGLLEYARWENFETAINRAKESCENSRQPVKHHFRGVTKMIEIGKGGKREVEDVMLTRYACYLIAQNGDPRKESIAFAQTYFAVQTRRKELDDQKIQELSPDQKRILLRNELKNHNKALADAAKGAGVIKPLDYAIFQNYGYKGLYDGLDRRGIQEKKGLTSRQNILDHMGSEELAANLFRATQTEAKLKRDAIKGKTNANNAHFEVGKKVRETILELGGTMPEELPTEENIKHSEKRIGT